MYNIINLTDEEYEKILFSLPKKVKNKAQKLVKLVDRKLSVMGYILLRDGLRYDYGINIEDLIIRKNKYGKPFIRNRDNLYYNVSHSENIVVCVISSNKIGVDISYVKDVNINVAKQFCNEDEFRYITLSSDYKKSLFKIFSLKESYIKMLGRSLMDIKNVEVIMDGNLLTVKSKHNIRISFIENIDEYLISICYMA